MIIHIEQINDFGIYKNFNWSSSPGIKDFSKKNIFMAGTIQEKQLFLEFSAL